MPEIAELTQDQKDQILALVTDVTKNELGPMVKEVVEEHLGKGAPAAAVPAGDVNAAIAYASGGAASAPGDMKKEGDKGSMFGRMIRALANTNNDGEKAIAFAKKEWGENDPVIKALAAGDSTAGGFIVPPGYSEDIIDLLTPRAIVRALGATTMPMPSGTLQIPKLVTGATSNYIGENADIPKSQQVFGMLNLVAKKLATLVPLSNDLIRFSRPNADTIVRNDVVRSMRIKEDITFIRANGTAYTPQGIRYWMPASNVLTVNATVNLANVTVDLGKLVLALVEADVGMENPGWMMAPRTWNYLMNIRDGNGNFAFRPEMTELGTLWGFPFRTTTQIPINLAVTGSDESEIYLVDFADVVIGEAESLTIAVSQEASYVDSGSLVSAFSRDQTVVRVIAEHDLGMRHEESAACLSDVDWE